MNGIREFVARNAKIIGLIPSLGSLPFITDIGLNFGPPWPTRFATSSLVGLLIAVALFYAHFNWKGIAKAKKRTLMRRILFVCFVPSLLLYIIFNGFFVYNAPDSENQEAAGFLLTSSTQKVLADSPQDSVSDLIPQAEYKPLAIWVPWTVYTVKIVLLLTWILVFTSLALITALLTLGAAPPKRTRAE